MKIIRSSAGKYTMANGDIIPYWEYTVYKEQGNKAIEPDVEIVEPEPEPKKKSKKRKRRS